ncbi:outer membrane exchange protein TraA family protein [Vitiosangium sp. GDMCC 1.1324]|uniref:outer membrane exchange protein TraA family protein n=1 Tax=Vitiosangium sp. (strain GDMCC 1.1324) TaxID=2138576 RepID=UPI000D35A6B0|nr:outer membrane exchange protein TraA family protein [Vitiosangium sp. GDMCC 1.1324]PTL81418.1 hypothetical protein DAT35_25285 [Vitiosangium sp. GDMCC 1.1324]
MLLLRRFLVLLPFVLVMNSGPASAELLPSVVVTGDPVAPSPAQPGTGLCSTSRISTNPSTDFPQSNATFMGGINAFLEAPPDAANPNARMTSVLRTWLDLSNNNTSGLKLSHGDFENAAPGCQSGGCDFFVNDATTSFGTRLRGYLNVTPDMVGLPVHFGFYADDAVAFTLYDRSSRIYLVINRPLQLGYPTWRTTNSVTFVKPGLYPIEVLYAEVSEHAALEMSFFKGTFSDFERPANQAPVIKLSDEGFALVTPAMFYQSETGHPSFPDLNTCAQCNRQYANTAGSNGCDPGYYCNGAALCDVCNTAVFCGASCSPCGAATPHCVARSGDYVCAECGQDSDCAAPDACHVGVCDATGACSFPSVPDGTSCPGGACQAGVCMPPDAGSADAGNPDASTPDGGGGIPDGGGEVPDGSVTLDGGGAGPDGGTGAPDASTPGSDGGAPGGAPDAGLGADAGADPGTGGENPCGDERPVGCGCGAGFPSLAPLSLLGLALLARRVRRTRVRHVPGN